MTESSLRIMVVEDDFYTAQRLTNEIRENGDHVVGPFSDVHEAIFYVGLVQAAILDVRVRDDTSFAVADSLTHGGVPFVFLTGYDRLYIPRRFSSRGVFLKPSCAVPLLDRLHREYALKEHEQDDSIDMVVIEILHRARRIMPDEGSAERLVEATLVRAIELQSQAEVGSDMHSWLLELLEQEFRLRGRLHLQ